MEMFDQFSIKVKDPSNFDEVRDKIVQLCQETDCGYDVEDIIEGYKKNFGKDTIEVKIRKLLIW